jgi:hypothetical protein
VLLFKLEVGLRLRGSAPCVDSPRWEQINSSPYLHEQDGLRQLADYLPDSDPYHVWANVEFVGTNGSINEVDALVLMSSGLYVLELKHWQGDDPRRGYASGCAARRTRG